MKTSRVMIFALVTITFFLPACAGAAPTPPPPTVTVTTTPDPCGAASLPSEVNKVHKFMREFDDASLLASNTPQAQLSSVISDMQEIRRNAEDQIVPACLVNLKQIQLAHMNTVINTLIGFLGGADQASLNQGSDIARQQHNQYAIEYARLLGLTVVSPPTPTLGAQETATSQPAPTPLAATNQGTSDVHLYAEPSETSTVVAVLTPGQSATALTQTQDGAWIQVEIPGQPGQTAWVFGALVVLNAPGTP